MSRLFELSEATAARRRFPVYLVDATDGITPETGEAGGQPQISKNGAAFGNTSATLTAIGNGAYYVELTATELDTLGMLQVRYKSANTAEFNMDGQVVAFDPYDSVRAGLTALPNAAAGAAGGLPTDSTGKTSFNDLSAAAVNAEVDTALADVNLDHLVGTAAPGNPPDGTYLDILADDGTATYDRTTDSLQAIRDKGTDIEADTQDIQSRIPSALVGGRIDSNAGAISGSAGAADRAEEAFLSVVTFTCAAGGSTTSIVFSSLDPASAVNSQLNGKLVTFRSNTTTAALRGQSTRITAYDHGTLTATVTLMTNAPVSGDVGVIT